MGLAGDAFRFFSQVLARPSEPEWPQVSSGSKVLVSRADHLGDLVMALPVIRSFAAAGADVDVLVKRPYAPLLVGQPGISKVIAVTLPWQDPSGSGDGWPAAWRLHRRLRGRYDLVVELTDDLKTMALVSGAGPAAGWSVPGAGAWLGFLSAASDEHQVDRGLALARQLGGAEVPASPQLETASDVLRRVEALLGRDLPKNPILLHPGAAGPAKAWPRKNFIELASRLTSQAFTPLFLAGPGEDTNSLGDLVVQPSLPQLADLARTCGLFVGNDSGPAHVAAAAGAATLTLFGPTFPGRTSPYSEKAQVLARGLPCQPCWQPRTRFHCPTQRECLEELSVDEVLAAVLSRP